MRTLLDKNRPVGGKDLKDYMEVLGYGEAARWVYSQARMPDGQSIGKLVSITEVRNVHQLTMQRAWESWVDVSPQLTTWIDRVNVRGSQIASEKLAPSEIPIVFAEMHSSFERVWLH